MTPDELAELVHAAAADRPVEPTRMFGSHGFKVNGKTFAMEVKGSLVLKLPAERVDALIEAGHGERFDPGHGRLMKEWVALSSSDRPATIGLVDEAYRFVAAGPAPRPRSTKRQR